MVVVPFPFRQRHHSGIHGLDGLKEEAEVSRVVGEEFVEGEDAVYCEGFVGEEGDGGAEAVVEVAAVVEVERDEVEVETESLREEAEPVAGAAEDVDVISDAGDSNGGGRIGWAGPVGKGLHEGRPLHPLHGVEVKYVDQPAALHCLEDGLVGRQMAKSHEWGDLF